MLRKKGWALEHFDQLILANDSAYGPLFPLAELLSSVGDADLFGASESEEIVPHLQSYFLIFRLNAKTRGFLDEFWTNFRYVLSKARLIWRYEFGISQQARERGLSVRAFVPNATARYVALSLTDHPYREQLIAGNVNNTLYLWDTMIERLRFPFLKTDIPRVNRYQSTRLAVLNEFLAEHTTYPPHLIEDNLRRLGGISDQETELGGRPDTREPRDFFAFIVRRQLWYSEPVCRYGRETKSECGQLEAGA